MGEFTSVKGSNSYRGSAIWERNVQHNIVSVELPTTAMQTGDIVNLLHVPENAIIVDGWVKADDLDSGTSLAYNIGDATTTNLFFSNTTTGQSAGASSMLTAAMFTKFAAVTKIKMTVATTAQTAVAGTFIFGLSYIVDSSNSISTTTGETLVVIS